MKFLKRAIKNEHLEKKPPAIIEGVSIEIPDPIYSIDLDEQGNFVLCLAHLTSSANKESILKDGLLPPDELNKKLLDYLAYIFPGDDPSELMGAIERSKNASSLLVNGRLCKESIAMPAIFLLPIKSEGYFSSAADNAFTDGGEVFKAARMAIKELFEKNVDARYPEAKPVVIVCKLSLEGEGTIFRAAYNHKIFIDVNALSEKYFDGESEICVYERIPPEYLTCFTLEDYSGREKHHISQAAKIKIGKILESQS